MLKISRIATKILSVLFSHILTLSFLIPLLLPLDAFSRQKIKQVLNAKINMDIKWDQTDSSGNQRHGSMTLDIKGTLKLNPAVNSMDHLGRPIMIAYKIAAMHGKYTYEETLNYAERNHCSNPGNTYKEDSN